MPVKKVSGLFLGLVVRQLWGYGLPSMIGMPINFSSGLVNYLLCEESILYNTWGWVGVQHIDDN